MSPITQSFAARVSPYVPRMLQQHLASHPEDRAWTAEGTAVFVDVAGFTKLSERLARKGREGSEQIADAIGASFESILLVAYENGASLLKFGGDSLLLWFEGGDHIVRGCRACVLMRRQLRTAGRINLPGAQTTLRMTQGVHSGTFHFFAAGTSHLELLTVGPAWSTVVAMEHAAGTGEIAVSAQTAAALPQRCLGAERQGGRLLVRDPAPRAPALPLMPRPPIADELLARCLPEAVREHVVHAGGAPEHRPVTVAFVRIEDTDPLIERAGPAQAAHALQALVAAVTAACEAYRVTLLASDVDKNGGKLILTTGAPTASGDDEERMMLALRAIAEARTPLPLRIGVHRGAVFAGDIGPPYRRTYTVMGDAVNLAARLMAKAEPGQIYATADVLDRSDTTFATTELPPLLVKGKAQPIRAWSAGRATGSRARHASLDRLPLTGREAELGMLREALAAARAGKGRLIDIVGEAGIGKSRLVQELREEATGFRVLNAVCEAYTKSKPYAVWREILREMMGFGRDDPDASVEERLRAEVAAHAPDLVPWLPLLAIALGLDIEPTPEIELLAENNRRTKLREVVARFLTVMMAGTVLVEIENAHNMDVVSSELLLHVVGELSNRPWIFGVTRRGSGEGFKPPQAPAVASIELQPLAATETLRLARAVTEQHALPMHVVELIAQRSGGNPQYLRDLARAAIVSGGRGLPDSAEAAAMARIDALVPEDRAVVRRAAVFGMTFHPRMLAWLGDGGDDSIPDAATWSRLQQVFDEEPDGYLRFHRSLLRDAAYESLPYKLRRRLHAAIAGRIEQESESAQEQAGILSLHYFEAGEYEPAWRYATIAGRHAHEIYAYVEAAGLFSRAIDAGRRLTDIGERDLAIVHESLADCWYRAGEFPKAAEGYTSARRLAGGDPLLASELLLKRSKLEEKLGKYPQALRWAARAGQAVSEVQGADAARAAARSSAWYANVLQAEGKTEAAMRWAERAIREAEAADDPEALGGACFVMGWAYGVLAKEGAEPFLQRALEAYRRSGNLLRQAALLSNLGVICQWEGRWDEALAYYQRGREESVKLGNTFDAALANMNIAEILADRGELAEAEALLLDTLPVWRSSRYRYLLGGCLWYLGRIALRGRRVDEAVARLDEARALFVQVKREEEVLDVDARLALIRVLRGELDEALAAVSEGLAKARASKIAKVIPVLERVRASALLRKGDYAGAHGALEASLVAARVRGDLQEIALTLHSLLEVCRRAGVHPMPEWVAESEGLVQRLKIRAMPQVPEAMS